MYTEVSIWFPSVWAVGFGVGMLERFGVAVCFWWVGVRWISKGRLKERVAAPVVPCGCCVVGLAPARTAAVWMSVWAAGITGKPFTPAPSAVCSPSPSTLVLSAPSFLFLCFFYPPCSLCQDCFILCIVSLSVFFCLSPTISFCLSARTEKQTQITAAGSCNSPSVELDSF